MYFFKTMFIEPFTDDMGISGIIIGLLIWLVTLLLLGVCFLGCYWLVDNVGQPDFEKNGVIVGKHYSPAYTTTNYIYSGKVLIPQTIRHPESWSVCVQLDDATNWINVNSYFYNNSNNGDSTHCVYNLGRLSGDVNINEIQGIWR